MAFRDKQKVIYTSPLKARARARGAALPPSAQLAGAVQPKVPGAGGGVFGRGPDDWRRDDRAQRHLRGHGARAPAAARAALTACADHRDPALHGLPRQRSARLRRLGYIRRGALHAGPRARRGVGGVHHGDARGGSLRLPLSHAAQRARVRLLGHAPARGAHARGVHRPAADAAGALHVARRRQWRAPRGGRAAKLPRRQLCEGAGGAGGGGRRRRRARRARRARGRPRRARGAGRARRARRARRRAAGARQPGWRCEKGGGALRGQGPAAGGCLLL